MVGYPFATYQPMANDIRQILFTRDQIANRIEELGKAISEDYAGLKPLIVGVLKGVLIFMADLMRAVTIPIEIDFLSIASFTQESRDRGMVQLVKDLDMPISGHHVIFVEEMVDTGLTLNYLLHTLRARNPVSLEVCALFDKRQRRMIDIPIKYRGFEIPDQFVVGYGLDYKENYRNLPDVGLLKVEILRDHRK